MYLMYYSNESVVSFTLYLAVENMSPGKYYGESNTSLLPKEIMNCSIDIKKITGQNAYRRGMCGE